MILSFLPSLPGGRRNAHPGIKSPPEKFKTRQKHFTNRSEHMSEASGAPKIMTWVHTGPDICPRDPAPFHTALFIRMNDRDVRTSDNGRSVQSGAHQHAHLSTGASIKPTIMQNGPGGRKRSHRTCTAVHDNKQPDAARWPGHCSARQHAALPNDDRPGPITSQQRRSPAASGRSRTGVG